MRAGMPVIQRGCPLRQFKRLAQRILRRVTPPVHVVAREYCSEKSVSRHKVWIALDGALQHRFGLDTRLLRRVPPALAAAQKVVMRRGIAGGFAGEPAAFRISQIQGESAHDLLRHLVLDGEDVVEIAVVAFGPKVTAAGAVDQLCRDPHSVARFADAALHNESHPELAAHVADVNRLSLEGEG
jgi:hypothetical protein